MPHHLGADEEYRARRHPEVTIAARLVAKLTVVPAPERWETEGVAAMPRQTDKLPQSAHELGRHFAAREGLVRTQPADRPHVFADSDHRLAAHVRKPTHQGASSGP